MAALLPGCAKQESGIGRHGVSASLDSAARSEQLGAVATAIESERRRLGVPGAAVVIVRDDRVVLLRGFGLRDAEAGLPVTIRTLFSIGSCTKPFTALALVVSADQGLLSLD